MNFKHTYLLTHSCKSNETLVTEQGPGHLEINIFKNFFLINEIYN